LIPTIIKNIIKQTPIPIYGNGTNVRDWLYVMDHVDAIDTIFHRGKIGETYCIGGGYQMSNLRLTHIICDKLNDILDYGTNSRDLITFVDDRKGHDFRYAIDYSKLSKTLNWEPKTTFEDGIDETINYYLNKFIKHLEL
jgi:dTDP-glucose 4,6-dehydratase